MRTPVPSALYPRTNCMYRLKKKNVPNIPSESEKATALPAENAGIRKNSSGIIAFGVTYS